MKTKLLLQLKISLITWLILWFIASFVDWELHNPFYWIMNLGKYTDKQREVILFLLGIYYLVCYLSINQYLEDKNKKT